ncbi:MAG TPA: 3'-5' exonuclease [Gemmatimonadales bacterium]|nr:3'-5' exonuclease [Gemmatimonadales bacterium]
MSARAVAYLASGAGPAASLAIVRDVLGIARANRHTADRIAAALLAPDPRFARTTDGRWTLATAIAESPALDACRFAVVDVETTGTRARRGDRIIEIAVVRLDGSVAFHSLINPGIPIPLFVQTLTGISPTMVFNAPPFDAVVDGLLDALSGCVFVAHNARFDWAFVTAEVERARGLVLQGPRVCTLRLARRLLPDLPRRNLDTVADYFGITIKGRHRAGPDAVAAARVLERLVGMARENGAVTLADLVETRKSERGTRNGTAPDSSAFPLPPSAFP